MTSTMNTIKYCTIISILASSVFAQESGFFISAGGGVARMTVDNFAVYNPVASIPGQPLGEALPALDRKDSAAVTRLMIGYTFNQSWDLRLSYANYGTAEVQMAFPLYPGVFFATEPDPYLRHALVYKASAFTIMPSYTYAPSEKLKLRAGVGVNYGMTDAHFEDTRRGTITGDIRFNRYAKFNDTSLSYIISLGADYKITENISAGINVNYTTMDAEIPNAPWVNRTKSSVQIGSLSTEFALTWSW